MDEDLAVVAAARHDLAVPGVRPADLPDGAPVAVIVASCAVASPSAAKIFTVPSDEHVARRRA